MMVEIQETVLEKKNEEEQPLCSALFSKGQGAKEYSNTRVLRPALPKPCNSTEHLKKTKKQETAQEKKDRLNEQMKKFESPFMWMPRQDKPVNEPETIIERMEAKDKEVKDDRKFKWRNFIFHLVITYELWRAKKLLEAYEEVCGLESALLNPSYRGDYMFACIEDALWHVVTASKAFLLLERDMVTQTEELLPWIIPVNNRMIQAGIHGIKAAMFMEYGHWGNINALEQAIEATYFDCLNAEWHFFIGKCVGRFRRVALCHELVDPIEIQEMNEAVILDEGNATYKVFLAQVLSERAFREYKKYYPAKKSEQYIKIERTSKAAKRIFMRAVELSPNSPHILIRCARGMMKLPPSLKDLSFTNECINKALELAPNNPMVHHVKAMYHERYDVDAELPLQAYEEAATLGNFGAAMDLVRLHHKLQCGDIIKELETLATIYEQEDKVQVIYVQAGSYMLFIKKDIIGALKYYLKVIDMNSKSYAMMSHKPIFIRMKDPVNMFDVLLEELATKTSWRSFPPEDLKVLKEFRIKARHHEPLPNEKKKRLTVEEILEMPKKRLDLDDLYKDPKEQRRIKIRKNYNNKKKSNKKWCGKNKESTKGKSKNVTITNDSEKLQLRGGTTNYERKSTYADVGTRRRDSSVSSVDSDYHRDSSKFGPREFYPDCRTKDLCNTKSYNFSSQTNIQDNSLDLAREPTDSGIYFGWCGRVSRDSSTSSISSACSSIDFVQGTHNTMLYPNRNLSIERQLTVENMKRFESSYDTKFSKLSLPDVSQTRSTNTLSIMDTIRKIYAKVNDKLTRGRKKHFRKHGSTQSLSTQNKTGWNKDIENKNGSSQSLNLHKEDLDNKFSKGFKSKFGSKDSSIGSRRSHCFMPAFACKNSESSLEK